ncbi:MAG: outer membrane assembly protein, partial [Bacteroidales bacterium]
MNKQVRKSLKIAGLTLAIIMVLAITAITIATNFVFTSDKLTPVVLKTANKTLNAELKIKSVELTFFSTFPQFGLKIENGSLVSKAFNDKHFCKTDSLLSFEECVLTVNPIAYLKDNKIIVNRLILEKLSIYAFRDKDGKANWDIMKAETDSTAEDTVSSNFNSEIEVQKLELKSANIIFDDRNTDIYSRMEDTDMKLGLSLTKKISKMDLELSNKNILFWQQGELLVNRVSTALKTNISVNSSTLEWKLQKSLLTINGIELGLDGNLKRDTVNKTIDVNLNYGLYAPSVETVFGMIPKAYIKDKKISAKGEVMVQGCVKGIYGKDNLPAFTLKIKIKDASAKYVGQPYGIDNFTADFDAYVDLMRKKPSYANLKIFHFKGANTEIIADGKIEDILGDPIINFNTHSTVDLDALAKTFPLQDSVTIHGKLDADLKLKCRLSSIKKQDIGRIRLSGKLVLTKLELKDTAKDFCFTGNSTFIFSGDKTLQAKFDIQNIVLHSRFAASEIERLVATVSSTNPQDTTRIVNLKFNIDASKLRASVGDSIQIFSAHTKVNGALSPSTKNAAKPMIELSLRADSLFMRMNDTKMAMNVAGIKLQAYKERDSLWIPNGIVGFDRLRFSTSEFALPIHMKKTAVTVEQKKITLKNASVSIGHSNLTASGNVIGLYRAITKKEILTAKLMITSDFIDCNQLINALSFPEDSTEIRTDTINTALKLFVIPANIDFEMQTNLKKVVFNKMTIENVHGEINILNQAVHLKELSMRALDSDMKAVMVYKAASPKGGYTGFDIKIRDINIAKLIKFIPELDTIVPMLRSFKGHVLFDITADARLDSAMNIRIPTLRSALHIKGDSLVLMDGETFAEISKMLLF